jgi:excisionase family DNA binding protein
MPTNTIEDGVLTIKEIAEYLKVTERTIYWLAAAKQMPAFKIGDSWRFSRQNIDGWIKQQSAEIIGKKNNDLKVNLKMLKTEEKK